MQPAFGRASQSVIERTQAPGHPCQKRSLIRFGPCPVINEALFRLSRPRSGRPVIRFLFDRARQVPENFFLSQLLCRFIKKFLQDSSRMKRNPTCVFTFRFQFLTRVSTSERMGQKMGFRNRGAAGS